jgi:N6-adenosine-specific RNA methylase IME4
MMARTAEEVTVQTQTGTNACSFTGISGQFGAILIDPPWRFANRTGKVGPEHTRLHRYQTLSFEAITALPVARFALPRSHLYLWCPNALLLEALTIMKAWGSPTRRISSGTRYAKTVALMAGGSASTSEM